MDRHMLVPPKVESQSQLTAEFIARPTSTIPPQSAMHSATQPLPKSAPPIAVLTPAASAVPEPILPANISRADLDNCESRIIASVSRLIEGHAHANQARLEALKVKIDAVAETVALSVSANLDSRLRAAITEHDTKMKQEIKDGNQAQLQAVRASIQAESARLREGVTSAVAHDVREPLVAAFRECFESLLIPSVERAANRMFDQVNATLSTKVTDVVQELPTVTLDPKNEIESLLAMNKIDEALACALGVQDLELITWLLWKLEPHAIFSDGQAGTATNIVSPITLLCLLQQLGADLEVDTNMKLGWLKEIALNLDKEAEAVLSHAPQVISEIKTKLRDFQATESGRSVRTELSLILRVL
jgi:hypothetical protein